MGMDFSMKKVNDECVGMCECTELDGHKFDEEALKHLKANEKCKDDCTLLGATHTCEERIIWDKQNSAPYDWDAAIRKINKECANQCKCMEVRGHVYNQEHGDEVKSKDCDEPCVLNGASFTCKARIEYSHDVLKESWTAAISKVNQECRQFCHCDELRGHPEPPTEIKRKGCDEKCDYKGTHHTCRQRADWLKQHRAPHTWEAARDQVNKECTDQCYCD